MLPVARGLNFVVLSEDSPFFASHLRTLVEVFNTPRVPGRMISKTTFHISKMDCPSEEQIVRLGLGDFEGISRLEFDLSNRTLTVYHHADPSALEAALKDLHLGSELVSHGDEMESDVADRLEQWNGERRPLWAALAINFGLFVAEFLAGILAGSMGLVADSLDMLADSFVYGLSLSAVGRSGRRKKKVARLSGYFQLGLALLGLVEVGRRLLGAGDTPDVPTMVLLSILALTGNVVTLWILSKTRRDEAHMQASWIFTSNDIKVNMLVLLAAGAVYLSGSAIPDLLAGGLIFLVVSNGARQILALSQPGENSQD